MPLPPKTGFMTMSREFRQTEFNKLTLPQITKISTGLLREAVKSSSLEIGKEVQGWPVCV
jgi:hypothetical protein